MYNDYKGISIAHIQSFLEQFPSGDLKDKYLHNRFNMDENSFYQIETNWSLAEIRNGVFTMSPAEIIYYAAKENGINPVLLLAKIQQEQSLIERSASQHKLNRATGYGIPNSNPAGDPKYKSFLAQLAGLTWQFNEFRRQGLTFRQAYDKYTIDNTGQDASFSRFMTIYENYAVLMDEVVQGNVNNPSPSIDIRLYSSINIEPYPIVQGSPLTIEVHIANQGSGNFVGNFAAALHTSSGQFIADIERKDNQQLNADRETKYTFYKSNISSDPGNYQIQIKYESSVAGITWDVIPENSYTNPLSVQIVKGETSSSGNYSWHGNGSLISYHGHLLPNDAGEDWPYGITQDVVQLHASENKPVGFFQWQINEDGCQNLRLDADGLSSSVDVTIGTWRNRADDITFSNVQLPLVLGRSNTGFRFEMNNGSWYVVKVAVRNSLNSDVQLNAYCTTASPTNISYRRGSGVMMDGGYKWNGNASVISHLFRSRHSQSSQTSLSIDWPFGAFKDTLMVRRSSEKPMVFFQWQRDDICSRLTFDAELSPSKKRVDIHVKLWNASNESATVYRNVTLPHTISDHSKDGNWRVIQIKFLKPVNYTAKMTAKCPGF